MNASMRTVPIASKKLLVPTLASEVRRLTLPTLLVSPWPYKAGPYVSEEPRVEATEGTVPWLEKLRMIGTRGAVLLRLRAWFENRGTVGGSAAFISSSDSNPEGSLWALAYELSYRRRWR